MTSQDCLPGQFYYESMDTCLCKPGFDPDPSGNGSCIIQSQISLFSNPIQKPFINRLRLCTPQEEQQGGNLDCRTGPMPGLPTQVKVEAPTGPPVIDASGNPISSSRSSSTPLFIVLGAAGTLAVLWLLG